MPRHLVVHHLPELTAAVDKVRARLGSKARLLGLLLVMVDKRRPAERAILAQVRAQYDDRVFATEIPFSNVCEQAPAAGKSVLALAPRSSAAHAFRRLALEVLQRATPRH
jgi:chromosome partitioning protein